MWCVACSVAAVRTSCHAELRWAKQQILPDEPEAAEVRIHISAMWISIPLLHTWSLSQNMSKTGLFLQSGNFHGTAHYISLVGTRSWNMFAWNVFQTIVICYCCTTFAWLLLSSSVFVDWYADLLPLLTLLCKTIPCHYLHIAPCKYEPYPRRSQTYISFVDMFCPKGISDLYIHYSMSYVGMLKIWTPRKKCLFSSVRCDYNLGRRPIKNCPI